MTYPSPSMIENLPAVAPSSEETFARRYIERGFRIAELATAEGIPLEDALHRLANPEVQAHLARLTATGEAAKTLVGPREWQERVSAIERTTWPQWVAMSGVDNKGNSLANPQAYFNTILHALELQLKILKPRGMKLKLGARVSKEQAAQMIKTRAVNAIDVTPEGT